MRSSRLALVAAFLVVTATAAQEPAPWAEKLFEKDLTHDFGAVKRGAEVKHSFKMTNIYNVPLEITEIRLSCECLKAEASARTLKPNETATITVTMQTKGFSGPGTSKIYVKVDAPERTSTAMLRVSANSREDVMLAPAEIDFGNVQRGQVVSKHIDIEYTAAVRIKEIKSDSKHFDLKTTALPAPAKGAAPQGFRLQATLKADAPGGPFKHEVVLKLNDAAGTVRVFNVVGNVQSKLVVDPDRVDFKNAKVGESQPKKVFIKAASPFRILGVDGLGDGITVDFSKDASASHVLTVNLLPTKSGEIRRQLTIRTDLDKESAQLTVEAAVAP